MEFRLTDLRTAFMDARYKKMNSSFKLFSFLLATSADSNVFPELLFHFNELDRVTGEEILVIAPNAFVRYPHDVNPLKHMLFNFSQRNTEGSGAIQKIITDFMRHQNDQTYALAKFLRLRKSEIPAFIFFDSLDDANNYFVWSIRNLSPTQVIKEFREISEVLSEKCGWNVLNTIHQIEKRLKQIEHEKPFFRPDYDPRIEVLREQQKALSKYIEIMPSILEAIKLVIKAQDNIIETDYNLPLENARNNAQDLLQDPTNPLLLLYIYKHYKRWRNRMPSEYASAIKNYLEIANNTIILRPDIQVVSLHNSNVDIDYITYASKLVHKYEDLINEATCSLEERNKHKKAEEEKKRRELKMQLQKELEELYRKKSSSFPKPLSILENLDRKRYIKRRIGDIQKASGLIDTIIQVLGL